jgi:chromosomal replication initiator protein
MEEKNNKRADLWDIAVALHKASLTSHEDIQKWDRHASAFASHSLNGNVFSIGVANQYAADFYAGLYADPLRTALVKAGAPEDVSVAFTVTESAERADAEKKRRQMEQVRSEAAEASAPARKFSSTMPLNESYTFDNFVRGPSNAFAYAIASSIAKEPGGHTNNPFFIWGGAGLGKTHLMQAIGHYVIDNNPSKSVCYLTSETFLNEYLNHLSTKTMEAFRQRYRNIDLLLLDDLQFIGGKDQVQEEFFNTYEGLMTYGKQVVLTCDVPPKKLNGFAERFITRFQQGITIEIELPSYETRVAILKSKARNSGHVIPEEVFAFIGENIRSSVRAMEGALNLVVRFMDANPNMPINQQILQGLLKELLEDDDSIRRLSVEEVIKAVCSFYEISYADMIGSGRTQPLATARQVAMFLSRKLTGASAKSTAEEFKREHTTVLYGSQSIQKRIEVDAKLKSTVEQITENLGRKPSELFEDNM